MAKSNGKPVSRLGGVVRGTLATPLRYLIYGTSGVGKSTLAAYAPNPIFIDAENGTERLDVARYPFYDGPSGHVPRAYDDVMRAVQDLLTADHDYRTLVIDTVDRLEGLIWSFCCERDKKSNIPAYGYGKGETVALEEWRGLCKLLDDLRLRRGMSIVLLAHAQIKAFADPEGEPYDRYQPKLEKKATGFLVEWADIVGFARFEEGASKLDGETRAIGFATGRRLIKFERSAAHDAKSRVPLPPELDLVEGDPWAPLATAIEAGRSMPAKTLIALIDNELARLADDELAKRVAKAVEGAKTNTAELSRYLLKLRGMEPKHQQEKAA